MKDMLFVRPLPWSRTRLLARPAARGLILAGACAAALRAAPPAPPVNLGFGAPAQNVGACGALGQAGVWQDISPTKPTGVQYEGESDAVVADPFDAGTVWLGTSHRGLLKSTDCGATWTKVNTGRNGGFIDQGEMNSMVVDPAHRGVIYTTLFRVYYTAQYPASDGVWKSADGGVSWDPMFPAGGQVVGTVGVFNSIGMDPTDTRHLIVSTHDSCKAPYGPVCVVETWDAGAAWNIKTIPIPGATGWVAGAGAFVISSGTWLFGSFTNGLWLTQDGGATWTDATAPGSQGVAQGKCLHRPFARAPDGRYYISSESGIVRSDDGLQWTLIPDSGGRTMGLTWGDGNFYSADGYGTAYHTAPVGNPAAWSVFPSPAMPANPVDFTGGFYLDYDGRHHVLYSSSWGNGLWRMVTQ